MALALTHRIVIASYHNEKYTTEYWYTVPNIPFSWQEKGNDYYMRQALAPLYPDAWNSDCLPKREVSYVNQKMESIIEINIKIVY